MFLTPIILLCIGLGIMLSVFVGMLAIIGSEIEAEQSWLPGFADASVQGRIDGAGR